MSLYNQILWTDRQVQFPARRKLTNVSTGDERIVLVERNEGIVYQEGNLFDAAAMNDLEERIAVAFGEVEEYLNNRLNLYYPPGKIFMSAEDLHLEDPDQTVFPGTTWIRLQDRVLLPVDPETEDSEHEGGSNTTKIKPSGSLVLNNVSINAHSITVDEMPSHNHVLGANKYIEYKSSTGWAASGSLAPVVPYPPQTANDTNYPSTSDAPNINRGKSHTHSLSFHAPSSVNFSEVSTSNMQKCMTIYAWIRRT